MSVIKDDPIGTFFEVRGIIHIQDDLEHLVQTLKGNPNIKKQVVFRNEPAVGN